jgi:hypothetical protein
MDSKGESRALRPLKFQPLVKLEQVLRMVKPLERCLEETMLEVSVLFNSIKNRSRLMVKIRCPMMSTSSIFDFLANLESGDLSKSNKPVQITRGLCNIILTCCHLTFFFGEETFFWLPSKTKVADEKTQHWKLTRQPTHFFFSKKIVK